MATTMTKTTSIAKEYGNTEVNKVIAFLEEATGMKDAWRGERRPIWVMIRTKEIGGAENAIKVFKAALGLDFWDTQVFNVNSIRKNWRTIVAQYVAKNKPKQSLRLICPS